MNKEIKNEIQNVFLKNKGYATTKELFNKGINWFYINRFERMGYILRIKRGLYKWNEYVFDYNNELVEVFKIVPKGVICLTSALSFHELTTYNPWQYEMAIERNNKVVLPEHPPIKLVYFSKALYELGVTEVEIDNHKIRIYDMEKTICDVIRYRNKIGIEIVKEGLNEYIKRKDKNLDKLMLYAKKCRTYKILKEYLEVLI